MSRKISAFRSREKYLLDIAFYSQANLTQVSRSKPRLMAQARVQN